MTHHAWLFPGQGSQQVGMASDAGQHPLMRATLATADDLLGFSLSSLMQDGPKAALDETLNTQPALYVHSIALWRAARAEGLLPDATFVAGHSLGEYSALTAAGALPFEAGVRIVRERGRLRRESGEIARGRMAAIIALSDEQVAALCEASSAPGEIVQVANYNSPGQVVVSGARPAVDRLVAAAPAAGARKVVPLDVSIAAHSPLMASVQEEFAALVEALPLAVPDVPVIGNMTAEPLTTVEAIRQELVGQLTGSVCWTASVEAMVGAGVTEFIEIGSGAVLSGLVKRIARQSRRHTLSTWEDVVQFAGR